MRKLVGEGAKYKLVHQELLSDLLLLCTSAYSQVRPSEAAAHSSTLASQHLLVAGTQPSAEPAGLRPRHLQLRLQRRGSQDPPAALAAARRRHGAPV